MLIDKCALAMLVGRSKGSPRNQRGSCVFKPLVKSAPIRELQSPCNQMAENAHHTGWQWRGCWQNCFCVLQWQVWLFSDPEAASSGGANCSSEPLEELSGHFSLMAGTQELWLADVSCYLCEEYTSAGCFTGAREWCSWWIKLLMWWSNKYWDFLHFQSENLGSNGGTSHSTTQIVSVFWCCIKLYSGHKQIDQSPNNSH